MKLIKRISAMLLSLVLAFSLSLNAFGEENGKKNEYPFIFIHGMFGWGSAEGIDTVIPYWGATTGNLMDYLQSEGIECYSVSSGPLSSSWDRACEVYAQLTGSTVDYGEAHSKAHDHERYGRTYTEAILPDWGNCDGEEIQKVHLIGHSHGGQVARLLAYLLTYGDEDEINATSEEEISGLFTGGKENWVESVTTICTPNNGTTLYYAADKLHLLEVLERFCYSYAAIMGRSFLNGRLVDFHLEQFGISCIPGERSTDSIAPAILKAINSNDKISRDLSIEGAYDFNSKVEISENITYFCYTFDATDENSEKMVNTDFGFLKITGKLMLNEDLLGDFYSLHLDESWKANDGLVNTVSAKNPFDEPAKEFDGSPEKGMWNIMPTQTGDHGTPIGLFSDEKKTHEFYDEMLKMLIELESA